MWYKPSQFRASISPEKRKSDSLLVQLTIRPLSYVFSSFFVFFGCSANLVSFLSVFLGLAIDVLLFLDNYVLRIVGASLLFLWLILDGVDGNIARTVKKEKFGEFMDGAAGYFLTSFMLFSIGKCAFDTGGYWIQKNDVLSLYLGSFFSICMVLSRLLYQKFKADLPVDASNVTNPKISEKRSSFAVAKKIEDRFSKEFGLAGMLPIALLLCVIFSWNDIFLLVYGCYFFVLFFSSACFFFLRVFKSNH